MEYKITVNIISDIEISMLDKEDFYSKSSILGEHIIKAPSEELALDEFHATIPIACLEDFDIAIELIPNSIKFIKE